MAKLVRTRSPPLRTRRIHESYPHTPDGRYFVVRGRLWRLSNPKLSDTDRRYWVNELMYARRSIRDAANEQNIVRFARERVTKAKHALGERGPPWWDDDSPDYSRVKVENSPYAAWFAALPKVETSHALPNVLDT